MKVAAISVNPIRDGSSECLTLHMLEAAGHRDAG